MLCRLTAKLKSDEDENPVADDRVEHLPSIPFLRADDRNLGKKCKKRPLHRWGEGTILTSSETVVRM